MPAPPPDWLIFTTPCRLPQIIGRKDVFVTSNTEACYLLSHSSGSWTRYRSQQIATQQEREALVTQNLVAFKPCVECWQLTQLSASRWCGLRCFPWIRCKHVWQCYRATPTYLLGKCPRKGLYKYGRGGQEQTVPCQFETTIHHYPTHHLFFESILTLNSHCLP